MTGKASRAFGWSFASTILGRVGTFGIGIVLARLLGPHAFGTYAVAYVALLAVLTFNELGISFAIVRWEDDPYKIAPTVTTISVLVSALIYVGCFFGAPAYAAVMGAPKADTIIRILCIVILFDGFTNTPAALLQRNFRQGQRMIADQANTWLGAAVTIALASFGYGAMSLAIGRMAGCIASAILMLIFEPKAIRLGVDFSKARPLLRFGLPLAGTNLLAFAVASVDQLIVGHILGPISLGFYVLALNLASWPITIFSYPARAVVPAVFARLQRDPESMRITFLACAKLLCTVALPVCLLIIGAARPLIGLIYGVQWLPSAEPLAWLGALSAIQIFLMLCYDLLVILARSSFILIIQAVWLLLLIPFLIVGSHLGGIYGAGLSEAGVAAAVVLPCYIRELAKTGIRLRALIKNLRLPVIASTFTGLVAAAITKLSPNDFVTLAGSSLVALGVVGALIYRMRDLMARLRLSSAEADTTPPIDRIAVDRADRTETTTDGIAEGLARSTGTIMAPNGALEHDSNGHSSRKVPLYRRANADPRAVIPLYHDALTHSPWQYDESMTSPIYGLTVESLRWDPAKRYDANSYLGTRPYVARNPDPDRASCPPGTHSEQVLRVRLTDPGRQEHPEQTPLAFPASYAGQPPGRKAWPYS